MMLSGISVVSGSSSTSICIDGVICGIPALPNVWTKLVDTETVEWKEEVDYCGNTEQIIYVSGNINVIVPRIEAVLWSDRITG